MLGEKDLIFLGAAILLSKSSLLWDRSVMADNHVSFAAKRAEQLYREIFRETEKKRDGAVYDPDRPF